MGFESPSPLLSGALSSERREDLASAWREALRIAGEDRPSFAIEAHAQGGEHLVFTYPNNPRLVGKVPVRVFATHVDNPDLSLADAAQRLDRYVQRLRERRNELVEYFGASSLLPEHYQIVPVPISRELIAEICHLHPDDVPPHVVDGDRWMMPVRVQWRLEPLPDDIDISFTYLESAPRADALAFLLANPTALLKDRSLAEVFLDNYTDIPWRECLDGARGTALRRWLQQASAYSLHTGNILDLAGGANVLLRHDAKGDRVLLVDPIAGDQPHFSRFLEICELETDIADWSEHHLNTFANVGGYLRLLAALSCILQEEPSLFKAVQNVAPQWDTLFARSRDAHLQTST